MPKRMTGNEYRTILVCVDRCRDDSPDGRIYSAFCDQSLLFHSTMQFLLETEKLLDGMNFPQSFEIPRSFRPVCPVEETFPDVESEQHCGKVATFALRVLFRQNASWQGSVAWLEGRQEDHFRSTLELLLLMHSAYCAQESKTEREQ